MAGEKILMVDNEEDQRRMMTIILERLGYRPHTASDAPSAIRMVTATHYPLILVDLIMPDVEGPELCERIKQASPRSRVYAYSGHIDLYEADKLKRSGFDGLIPKPIRMEELQTLIETALEIPATPSDPA